MIVKHAIPFSMFNGFYFPLWRLRYKFSAVRSTCNRANGNLYSKCVCAVKLYIRNVYIINFERVFTSCNQINFENRVSWWVCVCKCLMVMEYNSNWCNWCEAQKNCTHSLTLRTDCLSTPRIEYIRFYLLHCYQTNFTLYFLTGFYLVFCMFVCMFIAHNIFHYFFFCSTVAWTVMCFRRIFSLVLLLSDLGALLVLLAE